MLYLQIGTAFLVSAALVGLPIWWLIRRALHPSARIRRMADPVEGLLAVSTVPEGHLEAAWVRSRLAGTLSADGVAPRAVEKSMSMPRNRWPLAGRPLPVMVDRANPADWVVPWGRIPKHDRRDMDEADRLAFDRWQAAGRAVWSRGRTDG